MAEVTLAEHVNAIVNLSDTVASTCLQYPHEVQNTEDIVHLKDHVKNLKVTLNEVQQALKGPSRARISASWNAIEAIGKCSRRLEYLKTKLASATETMSSSNSQEQWLFSREELNESIKELSISTKALSLALQTKETSCGPLNDENLINRLNSASSFGHTLLSSEKDIRLIRVSISDMSKSGSKSDDMKISLENVPPGSEKDYQALSYTWGDTNDPKRIRRVIVNGHPFFITANLDAALRQLYAKCNGKGVLLWVDAICINQLDNAERGVQVSMMREIYENAKLVLIWLGPAFQNSHRAMEEIEKIGKRGTELGFGNVCLNFEGGFTSWDHIVSLIQPRTELQSDATRSIQEEIIVSDDDSASLPLSATVMLTEREWWERVWVLQELVVAKEVDFVCGDNHVSLNHFVAAIRFLTAYLHIYSKQHDVGSPPEQIKKIENLSFIVNQKLSRVYFFFYLRREYHDQQNPHPTSPGRKRLERQGLFLEDLLARTCGFLRPEKNMKATNPRDRVYAMLGMLSEDERRKVKVDYNVDSDSAYTEIAKALLSTSPRLLSFCRLPKDIERLPSWVPDWSASNMDEGYWKWDGILDPSKAFDTSTSSVLGWDFQFEERTLKTKGRCFDKVGKVVNDDIQSSLTSAYNDYQRRYDQRGPADEEPSLHLVCAAARKYLTAIKDFIFGDGIYLEKELQDDAVWKTAIADMLYRSSDAKPTRSHNDPEAAEKLRVAYKTILNGKAYEDEETFANRQCNRHLYQHLHEEGLMPHLVPALFEDYFDNASPWRDNVGRLFEDNPTLLQDMERALLDPGFRLDPEKREILMAGMRFLRSMESDLWKPTLLQGLNSALCARLTADVKGDPASLYLERFTPAVFLHLVGKRSIGRRAFRTSKGYIGLGPWDLRSGDYVVIVHGSTVPFILRKIDNDKFTLIGEAYVHGIMDGEGMTHETKPGDFVLC